MADKKISELTPLTGALNDADALPISDDSAAQTKKISPKNLIEQGVLLIADSSIPVAKIDNAGGIPAGSVGTTELADSSVTAAKLANNSSGVVAASLPASGVRIGQVALETTNNKFYCWSGSTWVPVKAGGSVNTITPTTGGLLEIQITQTGDEVEISCVFKNTDNAREFIAGPTASGGSVTARQIVGEDLPTASAVVKGAVEVSGGGLTMDGNLIQIDNTVVPSNGNYNLCDVDANGLVVSYKSIESQDLPKASDALPGAVSPGVDLEVDAMGRLNHISKAPAGTYTKVTTDNQGHTIVGEQLTADDIPDIPGDKINDSSLDGTAIKDRSITEIKLSDYSTCLVQEGQPSGDYKLGQFWFTPSTSQLRVYGRGSGGDLWLSVGFGALQAQNLRWAGTVNADTSTITTLTDIGVSEGLTAGGPIPTPTDELSGLYFVVETAGSNITIPNVNGDLCTEGDWVLYIDQAQGAIHLDIAAGGGGGGGASKLNDLTDVELSGVSADQLLQYNAISGMWENVTLTASDIGALAPGDDISELNNDSGFITSADVGDGTITIKKADGSEVGSFTVNQDGDTDILLPAETDPTGFVKLNDEGTKQTITGNGGLELGGTGRFTAPYVSVNSTSNFTREGLHVNGDICLNAANYAFRLFNSDDLDASGYTYIQRTGTGAFSIAESGGWGQRYLFSASQSFISLSNDNPSGEPTPITGATAVVHVYNGLNTQFGTDAAPLGNVMPKDDWSSIPALT